MNKYELAIALSVKIEDDARAALLDKAKGYIERFGGQITNVDDWGKRRLAYEVDHMKEAFYYFIQFDAEPTAPAEIENRIRIMENVVRFLIVRAEEA
ncbi:MAG: 30S ribosomal protein S6 [Lachnospiraceae bacterium]|nr:30S ribosomal protein S6 [Lachnospiraceae bacterium]